MDPSDPVIVVDTNVVLDLFVFDDPASAELLQALSAGGLRWLATPAMRGELCRVLAYPHLARRLSRSARHAGEILARYDQRVLTLPPAARACFVCKDPDDQKFIDLAVAHRATLLSKDAHVLCMARRLARLGVRVLGRWSGG